MVKIVFSILIYIFLQACVTKPLATKEISKPAVSVTAVPPVTEVAIADKPLGGLSPKPIPKIGIIFSGGGAKAWAHIGVLREIEKAKWPVLSLAGFEWGAAVAAIYANQLSSNEVEWKLSKIKNFDDLDEASNLLFEKQSVGELKASFVCPSLNINKQQIYLLNRGQLSQLIPFCLAQWPLSKPYGQSVAAMNDISDLAQYLRSTGAGKIVLINVLAQNIKHSFTSDYLSAENIAWVDSAALMQKKISGVDDVININLDDYGLKDIDKRREIIAKGAELGYSEVQKLTTKYGL